MTGCTVTIVIGGGWLCPGGAAPQLLDEGDAPLAFPRILHHPVHSVHREHVIAAAISPIISPSVGANERECVFASW